MNSSGTSAVTTSGDAVVTLITVTQMYNRLVIDNEGAAAGFFSVDGGTTWGRITASTKTVWTGRSNKNVLIKRVPSGTDMSAVYGWVDYQDFRA